MKKVSLVFAIAFAAMFLALSQANGSHVKKSQLDGTWELVSGQPLPKGARDIKIISEGHFIFVAYDTEKGEAALYRRWNLHSERKLLHRTHGLRERCNLHRSHR